MIGGPEMEDLLAAAATRRQDGGGHGDDARRGSGLGSDRPMGAAADATAALQQAQQQAQQARAAEAARVIDEVSRRVLGVPYEQLTNRGDASAGRKYRTVTIYCPETWRTIYQTAETLSRRNRRAWEQERLIWTTTSRSWGTDFLLAAAAELERRADTRPARGRHTGAGWAHTAEVSRGLCRRPGGGREL